tara:strand:- start:374 stop:970 length:597 start_codon:yes stop_codon:yes gene_type:complete
MDVKMIWQELREHIPFTFLATLIAIVLGVFSYNLIGVERVVSVFYILHPAHIFVSAIASAAVFYKYKENIFGGIFIGVLAAIIIGSLSDVILPYLGGVLFQLKTSFHLELIEKPLIILGVAVGGAVLGTVTKLTQLPHFFHVLFSIFASLFYLLAFSIPVNSFMIIAIFMIIFVAVLILCCLSDIIFPLLFVRGRNKN